MMRRSPITRTVLFMPEPAQVRSRYAATRGLKKAEKAGIIVVRASRTGNGVVPLDKGQPGLVSDSLNPAKARVLLMTALTQTRNPELIQSYFSTY